MKNIIYVLLFSIYAACHAGVGEISFRLGSDPTHFCLYRSGKLVAQFGANAGDEAVMPAGSIDFETIHRIALSLVVDKKDKIDSQIAFIEYVKKEMIYADGSSEIIDARTSASSKYLKDDKFLRDVIYSKWSEWTFPFRNESRIRPMLEKLKPNQRLQTTTRSFQFSKDCMQCYQQVICAGRV